MTETQPRQFTIAYSDGSRTLVMARNSEEALSLTHHPLLTAVVIG